MEFARTQKTNVKLKRSASFVVAFEGTAFKSFDEELKRQIKAGIDLGRCESDPKVSGYYVKNTLCNSYFILKRKYSDVIYGRKGKVQTHYKIVLKGEKPTNKLHSYLSLFTLYIAPYWNHQDIGVRVDYYQNGQIVNTSEFKNPILNIISLLSFPVFIFLDSPYEVYDEVVTNSIIAGVSALEN